MLFNGNYGTLEADDITGMVIKYLPMPGEEHDYADIVQFDLDERCRWYASQGIRLSTPQPDGDILDVGFWTNTGEYVSAEHDYRMEIIKSTY